MNYRNAIVTLMDIISDISASSLNGCIDKKEAEEKAMILDEAIILFERQIDKLPMGISWTHEGRVGNCPSCKVLLFEAGNTRKCMCGQNIIWKKD